ncbi:hypothetical protein Tcan_14400 [Toxocara canis]|uniref:Uncharacterized protein n=1 Tax=Toxocara canis TaxID=6265 RepID=A0A0B2VJI1_TOXCA|nr:hypothetical protein Tcan_14400 [Toxocara canis]
MKASTSANGDYFPPLIEGGGANRVSVRTSTCIVGHCLVIFPLSLFVNSIPETHHDSTKLYAIARRLRQLADEFDVELRLSLSEISRTSTI